MLYVGLFATPEPDPVLSYAATMYAGKVGWVDAGTIDLADLATRWWIDTQHARLGRSAGAPVREGYYLFVEGQVRAYHSGLIDFKRDRFSVGIGIAATIAGLVSESATLIDAAVFAARIQAASRVIEVFDAAMARPRRRATHQTRQQTPPPPRPQAQKVAIDEVELAFEVLGLAPLATQDEAKARYRALAKEWHPDRITNNAPKFAEAGLRMSQINVAYSVVCEARGW